MAFTVGWPNGNSVVSVEYADQHFADRGVTAWTGDVAAKQGALVRATDYIKTMFASKFDPLLFVDGNGDPVIPGELERATAEYGLIELRATGSLAPAPVVDPSGYATVTTKRKVGPIEKNFAVVGGTGGPMTRRSFPLPDSLIAALLVPTVARNRVTR